MRTHRKFIGPFAACLAVLLGIATTLPAQAKDTDHSSTLTQVGTYDYLVQPDFTGLATLGSVLNDETLGLGTFNNLDGELVLVGGTVFRVRPDGKPRPAQKSDTTPFLQAIRFQPEVSVPIAPGTPCADLIPAINAASDSSNGIVAVRVRGTYSELTTRSVTADPPHFQPLATTIAEKTVFPMANRRAALVGFRQGADTRGVGQDGLHLHALTADEMAGGHVLSCTAGPDVQLSIQRVHSVNLRTPSSAIGAHDG